MLEQNKLHLLQHNHDITIKDYQNVKELINVLSSFHFGAVDYISKHNLSKDVFMPGNIWATLHKSDSFPNWTYDLVNYSRLVSPFSGFHLVAWSTADNATESQSSAMRAAYDAIFNGRLHEFKNVLEEYNLAGHIQSDASALIGYYESVVAGVPDRYRLSPPPAAGEIGVVHNGRIVHRDLPGYQMRMNALFASGALEIIEKRIKDRGYANYLEIGPGCGFFAYAMSQCFDGKVKCFLVDLPSTLANCCAYVTCAAGADSIGLVNGCARFTLIPNYIVPSIEADLPPFDLVHNAISMNEMAECQIYYYLDFIKRRLARDGVFHLAQGIKHLDYHIDALAVATGRFETKTIYPDTSINGIATAEAPNSFFYTN